jgi:HPt (histidine-containing phosphotransfer) domain-containing protein
MTNKNKMAQLNDQGHLDASRVGIQLDKALERMMGDKSFLFMALKSMVKDFHSNEKLLSQKLKERDRSWLLVSLHNLKGISGHLAATSIYDATCIAEAHIKHDAYEQAEQQIELVKQAFCKLEEWLTASS